MPDKKQKKVAVVETTDTTYVDLSYTGQQIDTKLGQAHEHRNKTALNQIGEQNNRLTFRGELVGGSGGAGDFGISMLNGSGVLHSDVIDVTEQKVAYNLISREVTRSGERWNFRMIYGHLQHQPNYIGAVEVTPMQPRNIGRFIFYDPLTGNPTIAPVDGDNQPPLTFEIMTINRSTWSQNYVMLTLNDYDVEVVKTRQGVDLYKINVAFSPQLFDWEEWGQGWQELEDLQVNISFLIGGQINYHEDGVYDLIGIGDHGEGLKSSILVEAENLPPNTVFSLLEGRFDTPYKEFTTTIYSVEEVLSVDRTFDGEDRVNLAIRRSFSMNLENWSGQENHWVDWEGTIAFSDLRLEEVQYAYIDWRVPEGSEWSNWISSSGWIEMRAMLTENGIVVIDPSPSPYDWGMSYRDYKTEIVRMDVTRRL